MWAAAKFVFSDGYNCLEKMVDHIISMYPNVRNNRKQIVRLPLLWHIRRDIDFYASQVSVLGSAKTDSILIPQLVDFHPDGEDEQMMLGKLSFLQFEASKNLLSWRSHSLKVVAMLLMLYG